MPLDSKSECFNVHCVEFELFQFIKNYAKQELIKDCYRNALEETTLLVQIT